MGKVKDKLKALGEKLDKKALVMAVGLMLMSWTALPIIYLLIVRKKARGEEVKTDVSRSIKEVEKEDGNME